MLSLLDALGVPSTRVPIGLLTWGSYAFPPLFCSFIIAVLALMPHTRTARFALWPITALLALRAAASLDVSLGMEPEGKIMQGFFVLSMFSITTTTLDWTLTKEPLVRYLRPPSSSPSIIVDAIDLLTNARGYGWNWSNGLHFPQETRPRNRIAFVFYTLVSAVIHAFVCSVCSQVVQSLTSAGPRAGEGFTVFDETLPFFLQHLRVGVMTTFWGIVAYASLQMNYDLGTIVAVVLLRQDPAQWPPVFDAPWRATSLSDFWGRRWHQMCRRMFLVLGGYPLSVLMGPTGIVLGAFLASAVIHDLILAVVDSNSEAWRMFAAFGMMAPGMLAERAFYQLTGKKVGGVAGWVWTFAWLLMWHSLMLDGLARAGVIGKSSPSDSEAPWQVLALIDRVVVGIDTWLHSL